MSEQTEVQKAGVLVEKYDVLKKEISKIIVGQNDVVELIVMSVFCKGHSLLVGVPGLAKTLLINTIAKALDLSFNRIQFTPDLMPSDILGAETLNVNREFEFLKGPLFANIILADEINRTPPKTQAALLEAMQEKSVTIAGKHFKLEEPFFVLATQNPIDQEGTYPLPEAQLDRFMFNIFVDYPDFDDEVEIIKRTTGEKPKDVEKVISAAEILTYQDLIRRVPVTENVIEYAVKLVQKTRVGTKDAPTITNEYLEWGAGPRASQNLILAAKCYAILNGKYSPDIEDVQYVATPILRHRIVKNFKAEAENISLEDIIKQLF